MILPDLYLKITGADTWEGIVKLGANGLAKIDVKKKAHQLLTEMMLSDSNLLKGNVVFQGIRCDGSYH